MVFVIRAQSVSSEARNELLNIHLGFQCGARDRNALDVYALSEHRPGVGLVLTASKMHATCLRNWVGGSFYVGHQVRG
jgi:hypothetical protein